LPEDISAGGTGFIGRRGCCPGLLDCWDQRLAVIRLAKQYGRYACRNIYELLEIEGQLINHKKVERTLREEVLQLPAGHKRRKRLDHHDASIIWLRPHFQNPILSIDFVHDKLSNGRPYKMLTVLDAYTREALAFTVANKMGS
jgi:putative transposase